MKNGRIFGIFGLLLAASLSAACASGTPEATAGDRSETGMTERERVERIDAILGEKATRSPAQQKIESRLLYEIKRRSGDPAAAAAKGLRSSVMVEPDGTTLIDLKADVTDALLGRIETLGGKVHNSFPQYKELRAQLPIDQVETLAESPEVKSITPAVRMVIN